MGYAAEEEAVARLTADKTPGLLSPINPPLLAITALWAQTEMQEALALLDRRVTPAAHQVFFLKTLLEALGVLLAMAVLGGMAEVVEVGALVEVHQTDRAIRARVEQVEPAGEVAETVEQPLFRGGTSEEEQAAAGQA